MRTPPPRLAIVFAFALSVTVTGAGAATPTVATASLHAVKGVHQIGAFLAAPLDLAAIVDEDVAREARGEAPRFAIAERVDITPQTHGTWESLPGGQRLWRLRVIGREGTTSLNFGFTRYHLPAGARLFVYA